MASIDLQKLQNLLYVLNTPAQEPPKPARGHKYRHEQEYNPEDWSILSYEERKRIEEIVYKMRVEDISIGRVLAAANLPNTPSRYTWVRNIMFQRI
jgi:hypothetical protein